MGESAVAAILEVGHLGGELLHLRIFFVFKPVKQLC